MNVLNIVNPKRENLRYLKFSFYGILKQYKQRYFQNVE